METSEYANLDHVEKSHWYYSGKRVIVSHWIEKFHPLNASHSLLDYGAGTGLFAEQFLPQCQVRVLDSYPESLELLKRRFPSECILQATGPKIPADDGTFDCVTALDVLEHLEHDAPAVEDFHRVLRKDGIAVITVPADMRLWSDWDESLQHFRRYDRSGLKALFDESKWKIHVLCYHNVFAYPAVYLLRKARGNRKGENQSQSRMEDTVPPKFINKLLRGIYVYPATHLWFPSPFGVSLLLVARKIK